MPHFRPSKAHAALGGDFFDPVAVADFPATILRFRNQRWATRVGLDELSDAEWVAHFGRFQPLAGSFETPLALRYHGHQFQTYNPSIGDGRGFLFAQLHDLVNDRLLDLGTKGSGRTPWSRTADGRLTLKGGVREILATEMLEAMGVDTSKSFSLIETGEDLMRGDEPSPTRSSVLVRLNHSHIRIGTFQRLAYLKQTSNLEKLLRHTVASYMPEAQRGDLGDMAAAFMALVAENVARTGAQWIAAGFVHGVLNTDNINVTGESFDYGPWRFLPSYDPGFTAAYFDETGLYAFGRQPETLAWNLTRLAECLVPLSDIERLEPALNGFWPAFQRELGLAVCRRLGIVSQGVEANGGFLAGMFAFLNATRAPYEQFFFDWRGGPLSETRAAESPSAESYAHESFAPVRAFLLAAQPAPEANLEHPYFARTRPQTMLIEEVEAVWAPIAEEDDWSLFEMSLTRIAEMRQAYGA